MAFNIGQIVKVNDDGTRFYAKIVHMIEGTEGELYRVWQTESTERFDADAAGWYASYDVSDIEAVAAPAAPEAASEATPAPFAVGDYVFAVTDNDKIIRGRIEVFENAWYDVRTDLGALFIANVNATFRTFIEAKIYRSQRDGVSETPTDGETAMLTPDDIIALAIDDIRDQRRPANPARFADNVQSAIDSIRAENEALKQQLAAATPAPGDEPAFTCPGCKMYYVDGQGVCSECATLKDAEIAYLKQQLAAAQKALVAIVSIKYKDMQAIRDRAETGLIESNYYVDALTAKNPAALKVGNMVTFTSSIGVNYLCQIDRILPNGRIYAYGYSPSVPNRWFYQRVDNIPTLRSAPLNVDFPEVPDKAWIEQMRSDQLGDFDEKDNRAGNHSLWNGLDQLNPDAR